METIVLLTQMDENKNIVVGSLGFMNQTVFAGVNDALYHLFLTNPENSTISIKKTSDSFSWITIEESDQTRYYELHIVKPISFEK